MQRDTYVMLSSRTLLIENMSLEFFLQMSLVRRYMLQSVHPISEFSDEPENFAIIYNKRKKYVFDIFINRVQNVLDVSIRFCIILRIMLIRPLYRLISRYL